MPLFHLSAYSTSFILVHRPITVLKSTRDAVFLFSLLTAACDIKVYLKKYHEGHWFSTRSRLGSAADSLTNQIRFLWSFTKGSDQAPDFVLSTPAREPITPPMSVMTQPPPLPCILRVESERIFFETQGYTMNSPLYKKLEWTDRQVFHTYR